MKLTKKIRNMFGGTKTFPTPEAAMQAMYGRVLKPQPKAVKPARKKHGK